MADSRGSAALKDVIAKRATQEQIAASCGVKQASVSYWKDGHYRPKKEQRRRLRELYGIGEKWWDEPAAAGGRG